MKKGNGRYDYQAYDDNALMELLARGEERAFDEIYFRYADDLLGYVYNRLRIKESSEDVVQELFAAIWTRRHTLEIGNLKSYLYTAARHGLLNVVRAEERRKEYLEDFIRTREYYAHDNGTEERLNLADLQNAIEAELARLPERCREVYRMSRQQHMANKDIAEALNLSIQSVENYLTLAQKRLRISLGNYKALLALLLSAWF
jgi:RNA polymerase sigma-70 factor (ECF subfamily)